MTSNFTAVNMRSSCPRGRLGATRARCAQASAPQARLASHRRKPPASRFIAREARACTQSTTRCTQKRPIVVGGISILSQKRHQEIQPNGSTTCKTLWRLAHKCPFIAHRCPKCARICGRVSAAPHFSDLFRLFTTFVCNGSLTYLLVSGEAA